MKKDIPFILAGNPNVGKSTVFNALTGLKQHTGNWSGKTVSLASGNFRYDGYRFILQDLPGTYSLISNSPEEEIARDAICFGDANFVLVVADATCLARNLNLLLQILEITPRVALCVNLLDEASRMDLSLDIPALERNLGIPVIGISAQKRQDIARLKAFLKTVAEKDFVTTPQHPVRYPVPIEDALSRILPSLEALNITRFHSRFLALKLLDNPPLGARLLDALSPASSQRIEICDAVASAQNLLVKQSIPDIRLRDMVVESLVKTAKSLTDSCVKRPEGSISAPRSIDRILTSRRFGIPIMLGFLGLLLWITISGANLPSSWLMEFFLWAKSYLYQFLSLLALPQQVLSLCLDGIYQTVAWVTAVMLPPMLIFFPLFTLLEDLGYLPRLAFNLDRCFKRVGSCGKQALTMCMGLGCNAVGVTGCRIITGKRERLAAMITNCFIPCNGRFSMLITLSGLFVGSIFYQGMQTVIAAVFLLFLIVCSVFVTLLVTGLLTRVFYQEEPAPFSLELPPFRRPRILQILVRSILDRTLHILWRAVRVSAPAGAIIWMMANVSWGDLSILAHCATFLDPFARLMGMDGMILLAFFLALPANETVLPILLMGYLASGEMIEATSLIALKGILVDHGWTILTSVNVMLFSILHFPCATTLLTIKKESGSLLWTGLGFLIPTVTAVLVCMTVTGVWHLITALC
ncbi:MAG: ferrous iron transport protein B [Clostridia bacterium]|nr:ferrous iron transport protein B [Clostridia bacterium]